MKIQRYTPELDDGIFGPSASMGWRDKGDYVLYTDHLDAVRQARADALRLVLEQLKPGLAPAATKHFDPFNAKEIMAVGIRNELKDSLRAIIEKELSK